MFIHGRVRVAALAVADALCIAAAWSVSVLVYWFFGGNYNPDLYLGFWPVVLAFLFINAAAGLYHGSVVYPAAPLSPTDEFRKLFLSAFITHLGVIVVLVMLFQSTRGYSRVAISMAGVLTAFMAHPMRNLVRHLLFKLGIGQIPVVMAGSGDVARRVASFIADDAYMGFRLVGWFSGTKRECSETEIAGCPYLGSFRDIVPESKRRGVKILLACQGERFLGCQIKEFSSWFTYIDFVPTASAFPVFGSKSVTIGTLGGLEMVNQVRKNCLRLQKRMLDHMLAVCALAVSAPLFVIIPLLIKLTSPGPVFYRQQRLGRGGRPFRVWKFRSMYADADARLEKLLAANSDVREEWERHFKLDKDPRVTPLGRFLRRTSLDELPQLFNVFCGEMALIGPRPIVTAEVERYGSSYETVSAVRPGITGLWQVSGRSDTEYDKRVALDLYYVLNWSPWMDFLVLQRTVYAVLFMKGAC